MFTSSSSLMLLAVRRLHQNVTVIRISQPPFFSLAYLFNTNVFDLCEKLTIFPYAQYIVGIGSSLAF